MSHWRQNERIQVPRIMRFVLILCVLTLLSGIPALAQEGSTSEGGSTPVPGFEPPVATLPAPQAAAEPLFAPDGQMIIPPEYGVFPPGSLIVDPTGTVDTGEACPNPVTSATYNDVQAAINCAADGGTVGVNAGTYAEALTIGKNLTLLGASAKTVTVDANLLGNAVTFTAPVTVSIADLTIARGNSGIRTDGATVNLMGVQIRNTNNAAIFSVGGTVTLLNSTLSNNTATNGGSINSVGGTITIVNSTISGGTAAGTGGGIYTTGGTINLINATFNANHKPQIFGSNATVNLSNTIIANGVSTGTQAPECQANLTFISLGHNLASDSSCGLTAAGDKPNTDPLLGGLANNGGDTPTHYPAANSPAVDAGDNAICAAAPVNGIDQRGIPRPQNGVCDIGAVERGGYGANLIENGTFDAPIGSADSNWGIFPSDTAFVNQISGGVFQFYATASGGVVLQRSGDAVPGGTGMEVTFDMGNSSPNRKRVTVIAWDSSFADLRVCTFWLPGNTTLQAYRMQFRTTLAWANAQLSFYAATVDSVGWYLLDNVVMRTDASVTEDVTRCYDPETPAPKIGSGVANLVVNGDFSGGTYPVAGQAFPNNWGIFTSPAANEAETLLNAAWQINGGVFEYYKKSRGDLPPGTSQSAVILQNTTGGIGFESMIEATFQLGNSSPDRARVTVLVHRADFADLQVCSFWLEAGAPLATYTMRTFTTMAWDATGQRPSISFYSATAHSAGWLRIDNVVLRERFAPLTIEGTTCYTPGATVSGTEAEVEVTAEPMIVPTLEPTATMFAAPAAQDEQPIVITPTPTFIPLTDEGTVGE